VAHPGRIAIAAADDDRAAVDAVTQLIDRLSFDAVDAGPLEAGPTLEPDGPAFGIPYSAAELSSRIERARPSTRGPNPT
jgi:8-hydroxy-5-deazaflavin:NADPH oxidoreductase